MKKIRALFVLTLTLICTLLCGTMLACGGDDDNGDGGSSSEKITITYYLRQDSAPLTVKAKKYEEFRFSLNNLKRAHYTFAGMYEEPNGSGTMIIDLDGRSTCVFTDDVTLYVYWIPATYTLEFDAGVGILNDSEKSKPIEYGANVGILPTPTLDGYEFDGWFSGDNRISTGGIVENGKANLNENVYTISVDGKVHLTAQYKVKSYNVTFDYNDGRIESKTIKVVHGEEIPLEEFPQEDNGKKVLIAWSISTNSIIEFSGAVTQDIRLYAFYKNYKVFNFYDGINDEPIEVKVFQNEPYSPEALENRDGYTFKGWYSDELFRGDPVQSVSYGGLYKDFYANWAVNTYSLEFVTNGGIYLGGNVSYTIESDSFDLPTPTKANYTFVGWCKNEDLSDEPITAIEKGTFGLTKLYAKYKGEDKTLILDAGAGNVNPTSLVVEYGASYTLPVPTLSEHVFMGWYDGTQTSANKITNENGASLSALQVDELETTLYAHYMEKLYITTSVNIEEAGNVSVKDYYLEGDLVTLKATCNAGYTFIGYYENGNLVCDQLTYEFTMGASYITYELVYEANKYSVTLVPGNGATCDETIVEVEFGSIYTLPVPVKPAYTFIGWKLNSNVITDNNGLSLAPWSKTSNVTLYAYFVEEDPNSIIVYDATSFLKIKNDPSKTYSLVAEIDMTGVTWEPFDFSGTIKGNGMVIKNLTITSSSGNLGMFKKFSGTMQNLVFENLNVTSTSYNSVYVGGICAEMTGGTLDNIVVKGSVTGDYCRIGGFAGKVAGGTITKCANHANVTAGTYESAISAGGITAHFASGNINNCENYGEINVKYNVGGLVGWAQNENMSYLTNKGVVKGVKNVGGIVGIFEKTGTYNLIVNFVNEGEVTGTTNVAGGIANLTSSWGAGETNKVFSLTIKKITNKGTITGTTYVAGAIAYLYGDVTGTWGTKPSLVISIDEFLNTGDIIGGTYVGGLIGFGSSDTGSSSIINSTSSAAITGEAIMGGLVGQVNVICIKDCSNEGSTINATGYYTVDTTYYAYVGGYAGIAYYIENCENKVDITYNNIGHCVGGIVGEIRNNLKNCSNSGNITATKASYVSGIAGNLSCTGGYEIMSLTNSGNVTGKNYVGGVLGQLMNSFNAGETNNVYTVRMNKITNTGVIVGENRVGGCMGYVYANSDGTWGTKPSIYFNCTEFKNSGNVTGVLYVGGLVGDMSTDNSSSRIAQSSSSAVITAEAYVGGLAGNLSTVRLESCSNENSTVTATKYYTDGGNYYAYLGGYVGYGYYIEDCVNTVEITYSNIGSYVGGLAGRMRNTIMNSKNSANVTAKTSSYVGGLTGALRIDGAYTSSVNTNEGKIIGKNRVGGLFGEIISDFNPGETNNVYNVNYTKLTNTGDVEGDNEVGGIFGYIYMNVVGTWGTKPSSRIIGSEWENSGNIVASATENVLVGGFAGFIQTDNSGSALTMFTCTGTVNGVDVTMETLVGKKVEFTINIIE